MSAPPFLVNLSLTHPWKILGVVLVLTVSLGLQIPNIQIDTDPENMLSEDEFVRIFHNQVKKEFNLHDMIVLGVVNEQHPDGVFNPATLERVFHLTRKIETIEGVMVMDVLAPSKVDDIRQ
ncbi:MAG: RND transporter, partial [Nitrospirota bacterium]|nr:RND transporter [Nitrospirota bacterium]